MWWPSRRHGGDGQEVHSCTFPDDSELSCLLFGLHPMALTTFHRAGKKAIYFVAVEDFISAHRNSG